jgi:hypothetical protein
MSTESGDTLEASPYVTVNGYNNSRAPVAYFFNAATQDSRDRSGDSFHQRVPNATAAIGFVPTPQLSLFGYATATQLKANYSGNNVDTVDSTLDNLDRKVEGGFEYHFSPRSMIWAKISRGATTQKTNNAAFTGEAIGYSDRDATDATEYQFRHTVRAGSRHELSWGVEAANRERLISGTFSDEDPKTGKPVIASFNVSTTTRSEFVYVADRREWASPTGLANSVSSARPTRIGSGPHRTACSHRSRRPAFRWTIGWPISTLGPGVRACRSNGPGVRRPLRKDSSRTARLTMRP